MDRCTPNPEPWSDVRPRLLCSSPITGRAVLDANGHVHVESQCADALGGVAWVLDHGWVELADNINLDVDPWLNSRFYSRTLAGVVIASDDELVTIPVDGLLGFRARRSMGALRRASSTQFLLYPPNSWIITDSDDAARVKVSLVYRAIGGDPSVTVTPIPRAIE